MKTLLNNCASVAVEHDPDLKVYYQQKTQEGKAKMSALNAMKAKIINRVFATINRGSAYKAFREGSGSYQI
jgi:ABC-type Zn uptake system ZnuABC Zn-binding protein ZnuA